MWICYGANKEKEGDLKKNKVALDHLAKVFRNTDVLKALHTKDALRVLATCHEMNALHRIESAFLHSSNALASFHLWLGPHGKNIKHISLHGNRIMQAIPNNHATIVGDAVEALVTLPLVRLDLSNMELSGKLLVQIPLQTERETGV